MTRHEVAAKLDQIVAFAEVDSVSRTQIKHFSSGMSLRLAFAVGRPPSAGNPAR
jgi:lipopolysaccharide transport system ATP-binding protein